MLIIVVLIYLFTLGLGLNAFFERIVWIIFFLLLIKGIQIGKQDQFQFKKVFFGILLGYSLGLITLLVFQYSVDTEKIGTQYLENNNTAVVLILEGEPSTYQLPYILRNEILKGERWHMPILPFKLFQQKLLYERSNSLQDSFYINDMKQKLERILGGEYRVYVGYLYNRPFVEEVLQEAMLDGNGRLIITPVLLSETESLSQINRTILEVNPQQYRVNIKSTNPLWDSDALAQSFVERILQQMNHKAYGKAGVVLVGGPYRKGMENILYVKQEILFQEKIRDLLIKQGFSQQQIRKSFLNKQDITREMELLMEQGVKEILIMQVSSRAEGIEMRNRLDKITDNKEFNGSIEISHVSGWRHNDQLLLELARRIELINLQKWN